MARAQDATSPNTLVLASFHFVEPPNTIPTETSLFASGNGKLRKRIRSSTLNNAVDDPKPMVSTSTAASTKPGLRRQDRQVKCAS